MILCPQKWEFWPWIRSSHLGNYKQPVPVLEGSQALVEPQSDLQRGAVRWGGVGSLFKPEMGVLGHRLSVGAAKGIFFCHKEPPWGIPGLGSLQPSLPGGLVQHNPELPMEGGWLGHSCSAPHLTKTSHNTPSKKDFSFLTEPKGGKHPVDMGTPSQERAASPSCHQSTAHGTT